ncbi:MAG: hypothetical protein ABI180_08285 [Microcoleus sp.]|jgi:hypothetical protein
MEAEKLQNWQPGFQGRAKCPPHNQLKLLWNKLLWNKHLACSRYQPEMQVKTHLVDLEANF